MRACGRRTWARGNRHERGRPPGRHFDVARPVRASRGPSDRPATRSFPAAAARRTKTAGPCLLPRLDVVGRRATMLIVRGLHAGYGTGDVLHGAAFDVRPGEIVALLGRNGAGRST